MTDCNKIQANNLACNKISLTEQWKKEYGYKQAEKVLKKIEELNK